MHEQIFICIFKILNFVSVCFLLFSQKNAQILKGVLSWGDILLINPRENRENFIPAQLGIYRFQEMFIVD